jgi:hypothetical protein
MVIGQAPFFLRVAFLKERRSPLREFPYEKATHSCRPHLSPLSKIPACVSDLQPSQAKRRTGGALLTKSGSNLVFAWFCGGLKFSGGFLLTTLWNSQDPIWQ